MPQWFCQWWTISWTSTDTVTIANHHSPRLTDPAENVYPMIEAGKAHHEMRMAPGVTVDRELA